MPPVARRNFLAASISALFVGCPESSSTLATSGVKHSPPDSEASDSSDQRTAGNALAQSLVAYPDRAPAALRFLCEAYSSQARHCAFENLVARLSDFRDTNVDTQVGCVFEALRTLGRHDSDSQMEKLAGFLSLRSNLYANRSKREIVRLRAFLLVTLAELEWGDRIASEIYSFISIEDTPYSIASGARASASSPHDRFVSALLRGVEGFAHDGIFSLDRYERKRVVSEETTAQIECIRAIGAHGIAAREALPVIRRVVESLGPHSSPRLVESAEFALRQLESRGDS